MDDNMLGAIVKVAPKGVCTLFKMLKEYMTIYSFHVLE